MNAQEKFTASLDAAEKLITKMRSAVADLREIDRAGEVEVYEVTVFVEQLESAAAVFDAD